MATNNTTTVGYFAMPSDESEPQRPNENSQGTSDASSSPVDYKHMKPSTQNKKSARRKTNGYTRLSDVLLAFAIVFMPMAGISLILLGLTFYGWFRVQFPGIENATPELPILTNTLAPTNAYFTAVGVSTFLSVGSWSSTVAEAVIAPFVLIFSFFIALMALRKPVLVSAGPRGKFRPLDAQRAILKTPYPGAWHWIKSSIVGSNHAKNRNTPSTHLAGFGVLFAILLTILVIAGDQWLHFTTHYKTYRYYDTPTANLSLSDENPLSNYFNASSYTLADFCYEQGGSDLPCSLMQNNSDINVRTPQEAYLLLVTGVNRRTSNFQDSDFNLIATSSENDEASADAQIINYVDGTTNLTHAILFNLFSAQQFYFNDGVTNNVINYGLDYVATTTSMATSCDFATKACKISNVTNPEAQDQQLLYDCFPSFQGDLDSLTSDNISGTIPIEAVRGWNTSFYNATQQPISLQEPLNPFTFSAAIDLNSYPYSSFRSFDPGDTEDGDVINAGSDHLAFALNCTAAVFDVTFSVVNGSINYFNATESDPQKAAIIRAPLQAGFGANWLYQQATFSTISSRALLDLMADAFSQAGIAGSYGVFEPDYNILQRIRYDQTVTSVNKAALIFQATVCMLYAAVGLLITIIGLATWRNNKVRKYQKELIPPAVENPLSLRNWVKKILGFVVEELTDIEEFGEDVKDEVKAGEGRDAERDAGVLR